MKSRQRSEKRKQRFSEVLPPVVSKPQDSISNSTAPLQETLKLEIVGQTRTRDCSSCGVRLTNSNTYKSHLEGRDSRCKACWSIAQKETLNQRMFVNGKYVPKKHPLYKAGRYKGFEEAAFSSLENYKDSAEGEVYIITNPAWEGWVKVGMAVDSEDRLKNYQTSSPERDYELFDYEDFGDRRVAESMVHDYLRKRFKHKNEWFECSAESAMKAIDAIHSELHGSSMMINDLCDAADDFGDVYLGDGVWLRA